MEAGWSARRAARQLVRSDCVPTASSSAIQAQGAPSLGAPVSSRTIRRRLAEGHLGSWSPLCVLSLTPTHQRLFLKWCHARETGLQQNGTRSSLATNPDSISAMMTIVFVWGDPMGNALVLPLLYSDIAGVMVWGVIAYNTRSPLVLIPGTMTTQR
ncbi:HTH_Tnp_Tc3_2 domain-containing protein [Trichonephila clavipes]|nr:HTH_Tnp_Tc3_2 domain-containing protein [Trichonephila clavipes]